MSDHGKITFIERNNDVGVIYQNNSYKVGYLDLTENEKYLLEASNFNVEMTINSSEISVVGDRFILNRLNDADEIYNLNQRVIRCSTNDNIINFNHIYYFAQDVMISKFRQLAKIYLKTMNDIAFAMNEKDIQIDMATMSINLKNASQKRIRKLNVYFGPFESSEPIRRSDSIYDRYVLDESRRFIRIEDHLIDSIDLKNGENSIELKLNFPIVSNNEPQITKHAITKTDVWKSPSPPKRMAIAPIGLTVSLHSPSTSTPMSPMPSGSNDDEGQSSVSDSSFNNNPRMEVVRVDVHVDANANSNDASIQSDPIRRPLDFGLRMIDFIKSPVPEIIQKIVRDDCCNNERDHIFFN